MKKTLLLVLSLVLTAQLSGFAAMNPAKSMKLYNKAKNFYKAKNYPKAMGYVNKSLKYDAGNRKSIKLKRMIEKKMAASSVVTGAVDPVKFMKLYNKAKNFYKANNYPKAMGYVNKSLQYDAGNRKSIKLKRMIEKKMTPEPSISAADLRRAQNAYNYALKNFNRRNYSSAVVYAKQALRYNPEYAEAQLILDQAQEKIKSASSNKRKQAMVHYNYALKYYNQKKYSNAKIYINNALRLDPTYGPAKLLKTMILNNLKNSGVSAANIRRANTAYTTGLRFYKVKSYANAIIYFKQALRFNPNHANARTYLSIAQRLNKPRVSAANIRKSNNAYNIVLRFYKARSYRNAIIYAKQALRFNPNNTRAMNLKNAAERLAKPKVSSNNVSRSYIYYRSALSYYERGYTAQAITMLKTAVRLYSGNGKAKRLLRVLEGNIANEQAIKRRKIAKALNRARSLFRSGQYKKATRASKRVLRLDPSNSQALALLRRIDSKRNAAAVEDVLSGGGGGVKVDSAKEIQAELKYTSALDFLTSGDLQKALNLFRQVQRISPNYKNTAQMIASINSKLKKDEIKEVIKIKPVTVKPAVVETTEVGPDKNEVARLYKEGIDAWKAKNYEEAVDLFNKVLEMDPAHRGAKQALSILKRIVEEEKIVTEARELRMENKMDAAMALLKKGERKYPKSLKIRALRAKYELVMAE